MWKDGLRRTRNGEVQRYLCRRCGYRFSGLKQNRIPQLQVKEHVTFQPFKKLHSRPDFAQIPIRHSDSAAKKALDDSSLSVCEDVRSHNNPVKSTVGKTINAFASTIVNAKVCVSEGEAKNLVEVESRIEKRAVGATKDVKSLLFEFAWYMKKRGLKDSTIEPRIRLLKVLIKRGANPFDEESVKDAIARQKWSEGRKENAVDVHSFFLRMIGKTWSSPIYKRVEKLPVIPLESEIDQLISGCGRKTATFLQLLKECGCRCGEAWKLQWTDMNFQNQTVTITPEKGSRPRQFKVSSRPIAMLNNLPRTGLKIWTCKLRTLRRTYESSRKRIADLTKNPRILKISFHTFRHWKATMEYNRTKDILHVMNFLGHRSITNTLRYTQLIKTEGDEFISKVAKTVEEARSLVEAGFEYVTEMDELKIFRKRK